jgi:hypothetical protein
MESLESTIGNCKSCGTVVIGTYCSQCGEKVLDPQEKSIKAFFMGVFSAITSLDGKFLHTLKIMIARPGEVSYQYMNGRRIPYYRPMSMFFVANLIYFLFPLFNSLNSNLYVQMNQLPHSRIAKEIVNKRIAAESIPFETFEIRYNQQSTNMAKLVLVLMVFYFSIPLSLVNFNKKMYFSDHLLVSLEACSLVILLNFVVLIWSLELVIYLASLFGSDIRFLLYDSSASWFSGGLLIYLFAQLERRAYAVSGWKAYARAALLFGCFFAVLQLYRGSLFFITLWTL